MEWIYFILASSILFSIGFIYRKKLLMQEHALEFTSFRSVFNLLFLSGLVFFVDLNIAPRDLFICFIIGLLGGVSVILRNKAVRHDSVSDIAPLGGIGSIFVLILGYLFLGETISKNKLIGVFIIIVGIYFLEFDSTSHPFAPFINLVKKKPLQNILASMFLLALTVVLLRDVLTRISPFTALFYSWFVISVFVLFAEITSYGIQDFKHFKDHYLPIFVFSLLMFSANILRFIGLSYPDAKAIFVDVIGSSSLVIITFLGGRIFHEDHLLRRTFSALIILSGVFFVVFS